MPRSEDRTIAAIDDTSGAWVGIRLATTAIRRELAALLSKFDALFTDEDMDLLTEAGRRTRQIDELSRVAQAETIRLRRVYRRNKHRWRLQALAERTKR